MDYFNFKFGSNCKNSKNKSWEADVVASSCIYVYFY